LRRLALYIILCFGITSILYSQPPNFIKTQFTIEDGLPSNECHDIVQDAKGYIWIATDRGLARYDGYGFKTFGISDGLKDISCQGLFLDKNDNIWILTLSKTIYIYSQINDKIEKYTYDDKLKVYKDLSVFADNFYVTKDLTLYINFTSVFIVSIDKEGNVCEHRSENPYIGIQIIKIEDGYMMGDDCLCEKLNPKPTENKIWKYKSGYVNGISITFNDIKYEIPYNKEWKGESTKKNYSINNGKLLVTVRKVQFTIESLDSSNIFHFEKNGEGILDLIETKTNEIYTAQINKEGVKYYRNFDDFQNEQFNIVLGDISTSSLFYDTDSNLWVSTLEDGLYLLKRSEIQPIVTLSENSKLSDVEITPYGSLYFIENDIVLGQYSILKSQSKVIKVYPSEIFRLLYDLTNKTLYVATINSEFFKDGAWTKLYSTFLTKNRKVNLWSKSIKRLDSNTLASISGNQFNLYKGKELVEVFNSRIDAINAGLRIDDVEIYNKGGLLLGTTQGLFLFDDGKYKNLDTIFPIFSTRINNILNYKDGYLLGTQGAGVLYWDGNIGLQQYSKSNGLLSDVIENMTINTNGQIYLATYAGMSIMTLVDSGYQIKNYTTAHGLPSNEVYDIAYFGNTLYIATGKGLCKLTISTTINQFSKIPIIEGVFVNNDKYDTNKEFYNLSYDQNNIRINYSTIDYKMNGDISYRYHLNGGSWISTTETNLNYLTLDPNDYTLEIQSQNEDGIWSASRILKFSIRPPFYRTYWFYLFSFLLVFSLIYLWYRQRINKIASQAKLDLDLQNLERQALQAQMNPHFIFNCLHSIQSFIMSNDKDAAMNYLSRFAKLIRLNLQASANNELPLDKEIEMLRYYLDLELMRFNHVFSYTIDSSEINHLSEIKIPPILIQPFVENAILHGMKDKTEGGLINITFSMVSDQLKVVIKDNGKGIQTAKNKKRTSYGISITQKRFEHIAKSKGNDFDIQTVSDEKGTIVTLTLSIK